MPAELIVHDQAEIRYMLVLHLSSCNTMKYGKITLYYIMLQV